MSLLEFNSVSFIDQNKIILDNLSFKVEKNDFISIIGHSGSGKSTILKLCSNLIEPSSGNIVYCNKSYNEYNPLDLRKNIVYCFQTPYLFGNKVIDNIEFPYYIRNIKPDFKRIESLFSKFQMSTDYLKKDVRNLSMGEKQRIALIRSIIFLPKILLLDEITSSLDVENTLLVEKIIEELHNEGTTIMWITHNPNQYKKYANKVLTIQSGKIKLFEEVIK